MVVAYIRHEAFEPIRTDLLERGFPSLTITEVRGSGRQRAVTETYRGATITNHLRPKLKLECVVADRDGKLFVIPVEQTYRIRAGALGEDTLQAHPAGGGPVSR